MIVNSLIILLKRSEDMDILTEVTWALYVLVNKQIQNYPDLMKSDVISKLLINIKQIDQLSLITPAMWLIGYMLIHSSK